MAGEHHRAVSVSPELALPLQEESLSVADIEDVDIPTDERAATGSLPVHDGVGSNGYAAGPVDDLDDPRLDPV